MKEEYKLVHIMEGATISTIDISKYEYTTALASNKRLRQQREVKK